MYELLVKVDFEAAHRVVGYPGKCNRMHGHNWTIDVMVVGTELNELGFLVDFKDLKAAIDELVISRLDHYYLNELDAFKTMNPTAENMARFIYQELKKSDLFAATVTLKSVRVWESPKSAVLYYED